jgi:hypothetical protein
VVWFAYKCAMMMLLIVPVRVQNTWCMGPGSVPWDFTISASVRLLVVLLVVVWPVVSDMPIYDDFLVFLDMYMFFMLHVLYTSRKWFALGVASWGWPVGVGCSLPSS